MDFADLEVPPLHCEADDTQRRATDSMLAYKANSPFYNPALNFSALGNLDLGWVHDFCPEVVEHFTKAPLFDHVPLNGPGIINTNAAMVSVCMLRVVNLVAKKVGCRWLINGGSLAGAVLHGGPMPWDDDSDIIVDSACQEVTKALECLITFCDIFFLRCMLQLGVLTRGAGL